MTHHLKRKALPLSVPTIVGSLVISFFAGCLVSNFLLVEPVQNAEPKVVTKTIVVRDEAPKQNLFTAWKNERESCEQWLGAQKASSSYLDAYIIGVQKGATSELCMRLDAVGAMKKPMIKEWHLFNHLLEPGVEAKRGSLMTLHMPYTSEKLDELRLMHYLKGFPHQNETVTAAGMIPFVDAAPTAERKIVVDATVEYMLSDRAAFLAHMLTPHAKVVMTMREPVDRALSQYNMMIRLFNRGLRQSGKEEIQATPEQFDKLVRGEVEKLKRCGYDVEKAALDRSTSKLLECMYEGLKSHGLENLLYVTRGLYHLHVETWRNYFPDHRMHFVRFEDMSRGEPGPMQDISRFLCIRPFGEELLKRYKDKASDVSFGQQAAEKGLEKMGFESYGGKDRYMTEVMPSTKEFLREFYAPAKAKLEGLMGREMF